LHELKVQRRKEGAKPVIHRFKGISNLVKNDQPKCRHLDERVALNFYVHIIQEVYVMIFNPKKLSHYAITLFLIVMVSSVAKKMSQTIHPSDEEELIRNYLLNESPLYGYNRPKLWIHSKYEINARNWKDFGSRNTTDLNQPYIHLTIKSIIHHCGHNFNVCLIDDESFSKLLPGWDINLGTVAEPMRSHLREIGMAKLLYVYGGMVVPNTFVCMKDLTPFYEDNLVKGAPFVCESINHTVNIRRSANSPLFAPNMYFMGAQKNDPVMFELIEGLQKMNQSSHLSNQNDITGAVSELCSRFIQQNRITLIGGEMVGVKTPEGRPILLDEMMGESYIDLDSRALGIYIPGDEILRRIKYQWFANLSVDEILKSNMVLSKYLMASAVDSEVEYFQNKRSPACVVAV
jgi:hypothetical protein